MERLTKHTVGGVVFCGDTTEDMRAAAGRSLNRLAAYEDTGLAPEDIEGILERGTPLEGGTAELMKKYLALGSIDHLCELSQAERDGLLVVLPPCRVGDVLYVVDASGHGVAPCKVWGIDLSLVPLAHAPESSTVLWARVDAVVIDGHGRGYNYTFTASDFGKTVFLSRQEAEDSLERRERHGQSETMAQDQEGSKGE